MTNEPTFRPPTGEIPVYQPINLTEQIPMEYSAVKIDPYRYDQAQVSSPVSFGAPLVPTISKTPRPATIIWGLILLATGVGLIATALGQAIDFGLAAIWLLGGAGLALVLVAVMSAGRRSAERR